MSAAATNTIPSHETRERVLKCAYELTRGDLDDSAGIRDIAQSTAIPVGEVHSAAVYWKGRGLLKYIDAYDFLGYVILTADAIDYVEGRTTPHASTLTIQNNITNNGPQFGSTNQIGHISSVESKSILPTMLRWLLSLFGKQ